MSGIVTTSIRGRVGGLRGPAGADGADGADGANGTMSAASGAEVDAETDNTKAITSLALADSTVIETRAGVLDTEMLRQLRGYELAQSFYFERAVARIQGLTLPTPAYLPALLPTSGQRCEFPGLEYDTERGFYFGAGLAYDNLADWLTAIDASESGGVVTSGTYQDPDAENLIPAASLTTSSGWIGTSNTTITYLTDTDGFPALRMTTAAASQPRMAVLLDLPAGDAFHAVRFTGKVRAVAPAGGVRIGSGITATLNQVTGALNTTATYASATILQSGHEGDSTGSVLYVGIQQAGTQTGDVFLSTVDLGAYKVTPTKFWPAGKSYHVVKFTVDASGSGAVTLLSLEGDVSRTYTRLQYNRSTQVLTLTVQAGVNAAATLTFTGVALGSTHTLAFVLSPDDVKASLDGAPFVEILNVSIGGYATFYINSDSTGAATSGEVLSWTAYAGECHTGYLEARAGGSDTVVTIGDSFTVIDDPADNENFSDKLATELGRKVARFGTGGTTPRQQLGVLMEAPGILDHSAVIWDGGNGNIVSPDLSMTRFSAMRTAFGHDNLIFLTSVAGAPATAGSPTAGEELQRTKAVTQLAYFEEEFVDPAGGSVHLYVDPLPILTALSTGSANDLANVADGFAPETVFQTDKIHLKSAPNVAVAAVVGPALEAREAV